MAELAVQHFDESQIALIRSQVAPPGTTKDELALFLSYAQRTGLDPFSRQIYLSERRSMVNGQWVTTRKPEVTIDGFRLIAERTQQYAGQLGPFWCGEDGEWKDVWLAAVPPSAAKIGVLRHDFKEPVWSVALFREYAQTNKEGKLNSMWGKYPSVMLAKCAESLALRRAFPRELAGLYTREEMPDERTEARQAQADVAQERIKQLSAPTHNLTAEELDPEPPTMPEYQARMAAKVDKPKRTATPKKTAPPMVGFPFLEKFSEIKKHLHQLDPSDRTYYGVLEQFGYKKSSEIPDAESGDVVYKSMKAAWIALKTATVNREEIADIRVRMGEDKFWTFAGTCGIDQLALEQISGQELTDFLGKLREAQ